MVKKMSQLQQNPSDSSIQFPNLVKLKQTEALNQNPTSDQVHNTDPSSQERLNAKKSLLQTLNENFMHEQQQSKQSGSHRFITYEIQNKKYQLISLNDPQEDDENNPEFQYNRNNPDLDRDFRQPFHPLRFGTRNLEPRSNFNRFQANQRNRPTWFKFNLFSRQKKNFRHSILNYMKKLFLYVKSVQLNSWLQYLPFYQHSPTLESKYKYISMAILTNSINLQAAVIKALQYNIPLMQIVMNPHNSQETQIVVQKILKNFSISHFINQNFVLYGDWSYDKYRQIFNRNYCRQNNINPLEDIQIPEKGKIVFRKGQLVFAEIDLMYVGRVDHNQLEEKLQEIRNFYYRHKQLSKNLNSVLSQQKISEISHENPPIRRQREDDDYSEKKPHKTVKQIEEEILKDYLQQKRQEQIMERDSQEMYSQSSQPSEYMQGSSFYRNSSPFSTPQKTIIKQHHEFRSPNISRKKEQIDQESSEKEEDGFSREQKGKR